MMLRSGSKHRCQTAVYVFAMTKLAPPTPFFGWTVVWSAFVLAFFGWGLGFYGPPIYLQAVQEQHGWSVALVSTAVTAHFLIGAVVVANLRHLYARFGVPRVTKVGAVALAIGIYGWAAAEQPWQLFAATMLSGAGWVAMGAAAVNAIIAPWFVRTRPAALATAYNGASIGGIVFSPLLVAAIGGIGFANATLAVGAIMVAAIWLLADKVFVHRPETLNQTPDGDAPNVAPVGIASPNATPLPGKMLWRDRRFVTLAAGMALGLFAQIGLVAHLFSLLVPALGPSLAGIAMGLATMFAILGRTAVGWMMPVGTDRRLVAMASYAVQIGGSIAFVAADGSDLYLLAIGVALFGLGIGNATSLPPLIAQVEFVKEDSARVVPLIVAMGQASYAFAPAAFGLVRAFSPDNSATFFIVAAAIQALAIASFAAGRGRSR